MAASDAGTSADGTTTGDMNMAFDFSASDFATIVTTTAYIDKSLMIRDFYNASSRILITAPRRFGKSTNLDMVKRFFEIEVDARGHPKRVQTTNNYKLFKDYNLEISKDTGFFNEHFGKHPVVYIDFKPLGSVDDSAEILLAFKIIIENALNQHNYILQNSLTEHVFSGIAGFNVIDFKKYISDGIIKDVNLLNLSTSLKHLSTILNRVFGKKVFVLIDSYDAFLESPLFENHTDRKKLKLFVKSSIGQLLNNVNCVDRVLITGVIPVIGGEFLSSNIERYHFLDSHPFTKYYGLTSSEVGTVVSKVIECDEERRDMIYMITDYYTAYKSRNRDIRVYNVWSVLQYVCRRTVQSYWCERRYLNKFKKCFKIDPIRQKLEELLVRNELELDTSKPLSITDVLKVKSMITSGEVEHVSIEVELFLVLLYHLGYLSVISELGRGVVCVNIPSEEIKYELTKVVFDENKELYSSPDVNDILSILDMLQPNATDLDQNCETIHRIVYNLQRNRISQLNRITECLFMKLVTKAKYSRVICRTLEPNRSTAVLLKNKHQVAICVACDRSVSAKIAHKTFKNSGLEEHIFGVFNDACSKVIIAIGSCDKIAYSYYFKRGDNLQEVRTLPRIRTQ